MVVLTTGTAEVGGGVVEVTKAGQGTNTETRVKKGGKARDATQTTTTARKVHNAASSPCRISLLDTNKAKEDGTKGVVAEHLS